MNTTQYTVRSCNFDWHAPIACDTYADALAAARKRGFEARIESGATLVATWSPLYGVHVYDRGMAQ